MTKETKTEELRAQPERYREKRPDVIVEAFEWQPSTDVPASPVALEKDVEGGPVGKIYQVDQPTLSLLPGWFYWRVVEVEGQSVTSVVPWEAGTREAFLAKFDAVDGGHKKLGKGAVKGSFE